MSIDLQFDGSTEARGKNGWFQLRSATLYTSESHNPEQHRTASVWLYSKTHGQFAPIFLCFHEPEELRTLICGLSKVYAQMLTKEDLCP